MRIAWALLPLLALASETSAQHTRRDGVKTPNIVLIVVDDLGVDKISAYDEGPAGVLPPCTPNIDALANEGVLFRNVWTNPFCSPSRAQILTGRHGFRTGVGSVIPSETEVSGLSAARERTIPRVLFGYETAAIGKWHLASSSTDAPQHALDSGFDYFAGSLYNLNRQAIPEGEPGAAPDCGHADELGYFHWAKTWDADGTGVLRQTCATKYATTVTADEAIEKVRTMQAPWFLYVSFNAAHGPLEMPPRRLRRNAGCPRNISEPENGSLSDIADAMVEAMDAELGRMVRAIRDVDPSVYIVLVSDNGTDQLASSGTPGSCFDPERSKGSLYEGGVRVPLIIAGPDVVPGEVKALVSSTDIYATVTELARNPTTPSDSVSLWPYMRGDHTPLRSTVYAERFWPNLDTPDDPSTFPFAPQFHLRAIRNERFKLFRFTDFSGAEFEKLFDLRDDPCELVGVSGGWGALDVTALPPEAQADYLLLRDELVGMGVY